MVVLDNDVVAPERTFKFEKQLQAAKQKSASLALASEQASASIPRKMFLPGFDLGAMPNHLNRSSLIAPIARGKRKAHSQTVMVTRADCVLEYSGQQLDEADGDLIMALIYFAHPQPLGTQVLLNRADLLRKIGRNIGGTQYEWLHKSMKRLREGVLFLEARTHNGSTRYKIGHMQSFSIVKELDYNEGTETYTYMMDPRWVQMFSNREYGLIDFDKRLQIGRGQDMAKTLQRLVTTSSDRAQRYSLDWLKAKMEYSSPIRKFKQALMAATKELERLEIISKSKIEISTRGKEQLTIWLQPSA
jgi:Replication initiator protein A